MKMKKRSLKLMSALGIVAALAMTFAGCGNNNLPELIVDDPVIAVADADEDGKVSVTLSCNTKEAQLFYSIDGTDPSTEYSAPITLSPVAEEKTYTVKAQAKKNGYTSSKVVEKTVKVDAAEKEVVTYTVTFDSDGGTEIDDVTANEGTPIAEPTAPTKTGYTFTGWYNGETKYDFISNVTSDLTLKAKWTINTYTVTFDTDGGSTIDSITVDYNTAATQPATNPTKTGYTFAGWKVGETAYDFETLVTADVTIKAEWTINTYTITFDSDGGSTVESITVNYNTTATQPAEPSKDDAYFAGWVDAEGNSFQFTTPITDNITLKATWTTDPVYTVTVNPNYDGASTTSVYATIDTEYKVTLSAPSRTGYTFAGWTTDAAGTTAADFTVAISNNTTTFYAQWQTASFTVTFNVDGTTTPVTVNYGETINASDIPSPGKTGYTFAGWKNGEVAFDVTTTITSNVTLTATWTINKYTVTLDIDGNTSKLAENVEHGTPVAAPATTPTKTGYTFAGWKLGETTYDFATAVTADITLTAAWTINTYTVTFNTDGGSTVGNAIVNYNRTVTKPEDPSKDGYVFRGWVRGETTYNFSTPVTSDITLTAVWYEPQTYTYTVENNSIFITKNNDAEVDDEYQAKITNVIPDTDKFEIGDKVSITLKGYSKSSISELGISIVDNTADANYWLVLAEPSTIEFTAETQFERTVELTVKAKAIGTGAASQTIVLTYNGDEGTVIYKDAATMAALTPKSYTYTIPATATEPIVFISDDDSTNVYDDYKSVLTNTIPTLKAGDTVTLRISGASTIDIANLSAMIFDNTEEAGWYKVLSSTENFSVITSKTDFSELSVTLSITDDPVGTGADSQKIMLKYNGSGAAKIYDSAENIPDDIPADDPTEDDDTPVLATLTDWSAGEKVEGLNYSEGSVVVIRYKDKASDGGFKLCDYQWKTFISSDNLTGATLNEDGSFALPATEGTIRYVMSAANVESCLYNQFVLQGQGVTIISLTITAPDSNDNPPAGAAIFNLNKFGKLWGAEGTSYTPETQTITFVNSDGGEAAGYAAWSDYTLPLENCTKIVCELSSKTATWAKLKIEASTKSFSKEEEFNNNKAELDITNLKNDDDTPIDITDIDRVYIYGASGDVVIRTIYAYTPSDN